MKAIKGLKMAKTPMGTISPMTIYLEKVHGIANGMLSLLGGGRIAPPPPPPPPIICLN